MAYTSAKKKSQLENRAVDADTGQVGQNAVGRGGGTSTNSVIQAKLSVGGAQTPAEKEADRISLEVVGGASRLHEQDSALTGPGNSGTGGEMVQRDMEDGADGSGFTAGADMASAMAASSGKALDSAVGAQIGSRLGADFSGVRVHTDSHAQQVTSGISARAFTKGRDIYFNRGQYNPGTAAGKELLAHELTHTIQQGQVAQSGGIPVQQTASPQTAQRGALSLRKHFRQAVDERNENYEDYKNQSKWTRFKWAVKNPLAWAFGRTEHNQKKTKERAARRDLINSLDPDLLMEPGGGQDDSASGSIDTSSPAGTIAERAGALQAALPADSVGGAPIPSGAIAAAQEKKETPAAQRAREFARKDLALGQRSAAYQNATLANHMGTGALADSIVGGVMVGAGAGSEVLHNWDKVGGMAETLGGLGEKGDKLFGGTGVSSAVKGATGWVDGIRDKIGDTALNAVGGSANMLGGALGVAGGTLSMINTVNDTKALWKGGDKLAAVGRGLDAVTNATDILKGGTAMSKGLGTIAGVGGVMAAPISMVNGGLNLVGGAAKAASGGVELARTAKVRSRTSKERDYYADRLKRTEERLADPNLAPGQRRLLEGNKRQLELQEGFMRMGHNTARVDQTRAGYKVAEGALNTIGGITTLAGGGGIGAAINLAGTGVAVAGKIHTSILDSKLKRGEVDRTLDMDAQIKAMVKRSAELDKFRPEGQKINMTEREAKHIILRKNNYVSRSEAYLHMAKERKEMLDHLMPGERDSMVHSLGLNPKNASDAMIYQRLGLDQKQSQNVDRAILKQQKKRGLPSWRR